MLQQSEPEVTQLIASCLLLLQVLAPPVVPSLQHLSMVHCMLGLQHGSLQEADWLDTG